MQAQTRTRRHVVREKYANGNTKTITKTKVTTNLYVDLFNFYKKTTVICTEFDSITGKRIKHTERITKNGMSGKHCYEIYYQQIDYDKDGNRVHFEETWCDKRRNHTIEYENGKAVFIHIEKRRRRRAFHV
ncbi:MAG: hypothetical protein HY064_05345 [Bacteroidetes bacterium]|nr:hypothetical protein [Bacteroidota bacterium]